MFFMIEIQFCFKMRYSASLWPFSALGLHYKYLEELKRWIRFLPQI